MRKEISTCRNCGSEIWKTPGGTWTHNHGARQRILTSYKEPTEKRGLKTNSPERKKF